MRKFRPISTCSLLRIFRIWKSFICIWSGSWARGQNKTKKSRNVTKRTKSTVVIAFWFLSHKLNQIQKTVFRFEIYAKFPMGSEGFSTKINTNFLVLIGFFRSSMREAFPSRKKLEKNEGNLSHTNKNN